MLAKLAPRHRAKLASLLAQTPEFSAAEVAVALELIDGTFADPVGSGYRFIVCEEGDLLFGYACFGPIPMTQSCFDLYWLVVAPTERQRGIGRLLLAAVEKEVARAGGHMIRVETSGLDSYQAARALYERAQYTTAARIRDFYARGNDLYLFLKYLPGPGPSSGG
jgi:D-alanine-D-alanine ligase